MANRTPENVTAMAILAVPAALGWPSGSDRLTTAVTGWIVQYNVKAQYTPPTPTRRNSTATVESRRRRRCVLGFTVMI